MPKYTEDKVFDHYLLTAREAKGIQAYIRKHYLAMYAKWCRKSKNGFYKGN